MVEKYIFWVQFHLFFTAPFLNICHFHFFYVFWGRPSFTEKKHIQNMYIICKSFNGMCGKLAVMVTPLNGCKPGKNRKLCIYITASRLLSNLGTFSFKAKNMYSTHWWNTKKVLRCQSFNQLQNRLAVIKLCCDWMCY